MSGLLEHSRILIYGRVVAGISLDEAPQDDQADDDTADDSAADKGEAVIPAAMLASKPGKKQLATVYGFEFEGHYYDLPTPAIFLVHGDPQSPGAAGAVVKTSPRLRSDIKVWSYDKDDCSFRLDVSSGPLEEILLADTLEESALAAETSGKRVSGKRVSGKRVSGKRMSGD